MKKKKVCILDNTEKIQKQEYDNIEKALGNLLRKVNSKPMANLK